MTEPTVAAVLQRIADRLVVLGNKTRGHKSTAAEKTRAAHGIIELLHLQHWIENGGRNKPQGDSVT